MYKIILTGLLLFLNFGCSFDARIDWQESLTSKTYKDLGYVRMPQDSISISGEGSVSIQPIVINSHKFKITPDLPEGLILDKESGEISGKILVPDFAQQKFTFSYETLTGKSGAVDFEIARQKIDDISMSAYSSNICALISGEVTCWGPNANLGIGSQGGAPRKVENLNKVIQVAMGRDTSCALDVLGKIRCWGVGSFGELGVGLAYAHSAAAIDLVVDGNENVKFTKISGGYHHYCAVSEQHDIYCWGHNSGYQLGLGNNIQTNVATKVIFLVGEALDIAVGENFSCATTVSQEAWCWGSNGSRQLGSGGTSPSAIALPLRVVKLGTSEPLTGVTSIKAGYTTACALSDGALFCWGANTYLQIENIFGTTVNGAYKVDGVGAISSYSLSSVHMCYVREGVGFCSGLNSMGNLGNGNRESVNGRYPVAGGYFFEKIVTGGWINPRYAGATCALTPQKKLMCWGSNYGNLATPLRSLKAAPEKMMDSKTANMIYKQDVLNSGICKIQNNKVYCAHANDYQRAGVSGNHWISSWSEVSGLPSDYQPIRVKTGPYMACVLMSREMEPEVSNQLWCWGYNGLGGRGDGTNVGDGVPTKSNLENIEEFKLGTHGMCALDNKNDLYCVGSNAQKQLGPAIECRDLASSTSWCKVASKISYFESQGHWNCLVTQAGEAKCWGEVLGATYSSDFVNLAGIPLSEKISKLSISGRQMCALASSGNIYCMGAGADSLANRVPISTIVTVDTNVFSKIDELAGVKDIYSLGRGSYCLVKNDQKIFCRGDARFLPLYHENRTFYPELTELLVPFVTGKVEMLYRYSICLRDIASDLYCWGASVDINLIKGGDDGAVISTPIYVEGI